MQSINLTRLGKSSLIVNRVGLGCVGMSESYGIPNDEESLKTLEYALELGVNFFDTADAYGVGHNELLLANILKRHRDRIIIGTKVGFVRTKVNDNWNTICGRPEYVESACNASLKRLGIDTIDLYYLHRADPSLAIEETVGAMSKLVEQGKVRHIGLSEVDSSTLRRANKIHPISALQSEYSLWWRQPEDELLNVCKELNITFVAFSPLGQGFLSGAFKDYKLFTNQDVRAQMPRFSPENLSRNCEWLRNLELIAQQKNCTPAQLSLAWMLNKHPDLVAIPGTKQKCYLKENVASNAITLSQEECAIIENKLPLQAVVGERF